MPSFKFPLAVLLAAGAATAQAHHGWSSYDAGKTVRVETALVEVKIANPHAEAVIDHDGKRWQVVLAPVTRMAARGMTDGMLMVGKVITIEGYPRVDGTAELRAERIIVDGKTIELR